MGNLMPDIGIRPKLVALYFSNLPKSPADQIEEEVRDILERRAVHHMSFVGKSVIEILVETRQREEVTSFLKAARMVCIFRHYVFDSPSGRRRNEDTHINLERNAWTIIFCSRSCIDAATSRAAKLWCRGPATAADKKFNHL